MNLKEAEANLQKILSEHPDIWKTQPSWWSWVRGGLRGGVWNKHPVKLEYIKHKRYKAKLGRVTKSNPNGEVWVGDCEVCGKRYRQNKLQVDHLHPAGRLKSVENIGDFVLRLILVTFDDLQLACKHCHDILSYSERYEISFEEASKRKLVIKYIGSMSVANLKKALTREYSINGRNIKNAEQRKEAVTELVELGRITWKDVK